jgi:hypothetical protein
LKHVNLSQVRTCNAVLHFRDVAFFLAIIGIQALSWMFVLFLEEGHGITVRWCDCIWGHYLHWQSLSFLISHASYADVIYTVAMLLATRYFSELTMLID